MAVLDRLAAAPDADEMNLKALERRVELHEDMGDLLGAFSAEDPPHCVKMRSRFRLAEVDLHFVQASIDTSADGGADDLRRRKVER